MNGNVSLLLPILVPVLGGILVVLVPQLREQREQKARWMFVALVLVLTGALAAAQLFGGNRELRLVWLSETLSFYFKVDPVSRIFAVLICLMWLLTGVFSFESMKREEKHARYYCYYLISQGALLGLAFAGNYLTMYLCFEWMSLMTVPLVLHKGTQEARRAALSYLLYSTAGASLGLMGIPALLRFGTTLDFVPGGVLDLSAVQGHEGLLLGIVFAVVLGFAAKADVFPFHAWLPVAYPAAPVSAAAVLSSVITKAGVIAVIRVIYYQVGVGFLAGTWVQTAWLIIALVTVFMGSAVAFGTKNLQKRMAYSTISQLSYVLFGLFLFNGTAMTGALLHVVCHSVVKDALFLAVGAMIYKTGKTEVGELRGIGKEMPIVMWCFTLASLALVGIPPLCGFLSKWYLCMGSLESGLGVISWLGPVVLIISALLTAGYLLSITVKGFFPGDDYHYGALVKKEPSAFMTVPLILLTAAAAFSIYPKPVMTLIGRIVSAVL